MVMEASGVYTEPVYYALREQDFTEVAVVNPAHAKALKGHKTDAKDCARLAELSGCGLLRGSYIRPAELEGAPDLTRCRIKDGPGPHPGGSSGRARRRDRPAARPARERPALPGSRPRR